MQTRTKRLRFNTAKFVEDSPQGRRVEISLSFAERDIQATEDCDADEISQLKAVVVATLRATEEAIQHRFSCQLSDLDHVHALGKNLIAVLIDINFEGKDVQVFGSCPISGSEHDAAAKAALNATNRFVELADQD